VCSDCVVAIGLCKILGVANAITVAECTEQLSPPGSEDTMMGLSLMVMLWQHW